MPKSWTLEADRTMLLFCVISAGPTMDTFTQVANQLGDVQPKAVRQRFYKLKAEAAALHAEGAAPTTPKKSKAAPSGASKTPGTGMGSVKKRKANADESTQKRNKNSTVKEEPESEEAEGGPVSVSNSNESTIKEEPDSEQDEGGSAVVENTEEGERDELENITVVDAEESI